MADYDPNAHDWTFKNLQTLYENDSICVKQFIVAYYDGANIYRERDYRYIYLVDMMESRFRHQIVYNETFINTFWMPEDVAEELRRKIRREDINVYDEMRSKTLPVRHPFDLD